MSRVSLDGLVSGLADSHGLSKTVTKAVLIDAFNHIKAMVASGDDVSIPKFGLFTSARSAAYSARNPQTGATVRVPAKDRVKFRAYTAFKCEVNGK